MKNRFSRQGRPLHCRLPILPTFFYEGEGTGGGGSTTPPAPAPTNPADVAARYSGDVVRMASHISTLESENYKHREKARDDERTISDLKAKLPGADTVVLPKAKIELLEKYEKLGTPEVLTTELETGRVARGRVAEVEKAATLEKAAKVAGLKPGLLKIVGKDLPIAVREVEIADAEGKTSKVERAFIVGKNGDAETLTPLADHFKSQGEDVLQSLLDDNSGGQTGGSGNHNSNGNGSGSGFQYPAQSGGTGGQNNAPASYAGGLYAQHNAPVAKQGS
ncbi:hypothetical protein IAD21_00576 [Abditibacteriota bacterium]|nr:hypothetical protein IAD21_00576 [Abditibacteriota bacterium]